jgi:stress-induced morphogen
MENLEEVNTVINQRQESKDCRNYTVEILEENLYVKTKKKIKKCPFFEETFTTRSLKNKHIDQAHEGIRYFMCPDCGHRYTCAICGKNFAGVSCLKQHISATHGKMNLRPQ